MADTTTTLADAVTDLRSPSRRNGVPVDRNCIVCGAPLTDPRAKTCRAAACKKALQKARMDKWRQANGRAKQSPNDRSCIVCGIPLTGYLPQARVCRDKLCQSRARGPRVGRSQRPRGPTSWNPSAESAALIAQVREILAAQGAYLPLTLRQIFYLLVAGYEYPKDDKAYRLLGYTVGRARRDDLIPFEAIRDDGIASHDPISYVNRSDFYRHCRAWAKQYRLDRQGGQERYVELWCEAAGMVPQLARIVDPMGIPIYSSGGFVSLTAVRECANRVLDRGVPTVLLHIGDFDPSGAAIYRALIDDVTGFATADGGEVEGRRLALTAEQVATCGLPTVPTKRTDTRRVTWIEEYGDVTAQLEALSPAMLAEIVRAELSSIFDEATLAEQVKVEDDHRVELEAALALLDDEGPV